MKKIGLSILVLFISNFSFSQESYFGAWQAGSGEEQVRITTSLDAWIDYANDFVNNQGLYLKDFEYYEINGQSRYFGAWQTGSGEEQVRITTSLDAWIDYANDFVNNQGLYLKDFEYYEINGQSRYFGAWQAGSGEEQVRITTSLDAWIDYANDFVNNQGLYLKDFEYYEINEQSYYFGAWQTGSGEEQVRITSDLDGWIDYANDFVNNQGLYLKDFEYYGTVLSNTSAQTIDSEISIFPNPADHYLTINTQTEEILKVTIYNSIGQPVFTGDEVSSSQSIDIGHLEKGIYAVTVEIADSVISRKIIVN